MRNDNLLVRAFRDKVFEELDRVTHMAGMVRPEWLDTGPERGFRFRQLLHHLLECMAGFCAVLNAALPGGLDEADQLREGLRRVPTDPEDLLDRMEQYMVTLDKGFGKLPDSELGRRLPTVFVPDGEPLLTLLLSNYSHLVAHKYQLFAYLKTAGAPVGTRDLYVFREVPVNTRI